MNHLNDETVSIKIQKIKVCQINEVADIVLETYLQEFETIFFINIIITYPFKEKISERVWIVLPYSYFILLEKMVHTINDLQVICTVMLTIFRYLQNLHFWCKRRTIVQDIGNIRTLWASFAHSRRHPGLLVHFQPLHINATEMNNTVDIELYWSNNRNVLLSSFCY